MKRRIFKLGLFLLLGAIINVAVAWACAVWIDVTQIVSSKATGGMSDEVWEAASASRSGAEWFFVLRMRPMKDGWLRELPADSNISIPRWMPWKLPSVEYRSATSPVVEILVADARGWPLISLCSKRSDILAREDYARMHRSIPSLKMGIDSGLSWQVRGGNWPRDLPVVPLWPGFAINTIFYAALLWLLFAFPGVVRRRMRAHRGRCTGCGYDLRGSGSDHNLCPECGSIKASMTND